MGVVERFRIEGFMVFFFFFRGGGGESLQGVLVCRFSRPAQLGGRKVWRTLSGRIPQDPMHSKTMKLFNEAIWDVPPSTNRP